MPRSQVHRLPSFTVSFCPPHKERCLYICSLSFSGRGSSDRQDGWGTTPLRLVTPGGPHWPAPQRIKERQKNRVKEDRKRPRCHTTPSNYTTSFLSLISLSAAMDIWITARYPPVWATNKEKRQRTAYKAWTRFLSAQSKMCQMYSCLLCCYWLASCWFSYVFFFLPIAFIWYNR